MKIIFFITALSLCVLSLVNGMDNLNMDLKNDEIAEAQQSEAVFTVATDKKPIVATYGCWPCIGVGGYEQTNQLAFVIHFSEATEVKKCGGLILDNILKFVTKPITTPIKIHLRGGYKGMSEHTIAAIKVWMGQRKDLPMKTESEDILTGKVKSLLIDSRTGKVGEYDPISNPYHRRRTELDDLRGLFKILSEHNQNIEVVYSPSLKGITIQDSCANCGKTFTDYRCGNCKQVSYCSRDCQVADWSRHKKFCTKK